MRFMYFVGVFIETQVPIVNYAAQNLADVLPDSSLE